MTFFITCPLKTSRDTFKISTPSSSFISHVNAGGESFELSVVVIRTFLVASGYDVTAEHVRNEMNAAVYLQMSGHYEEIVSCQP